MKWNFNVEFHGIKDKTNFEKKRENVVWEKF